ncbi:starch synthase [Caloramator quimbayensis]|uniref:Glycogen synthase n=1 Tax=Caloramator quimbayensis TaxID=1147123 RepID=A0A1T4WG35_9CLOT|nr:glycogen synthase [Caloramator quimbayensis]SKA75611.1 starch synthase [Caloramator quimbayensis]
MKRKIRVLFVTAECCPYAKVGGLGQISGSLPKKLGENIDIRRVTPLHRSSFIDFKYKIDFPVKIGDKFETCIVKTASNEDIPTYFIANDYYFNRDKIYSYFDDGERFLFFCKAVLNMLKNIPFKPDIIHCNDWHTGFLPMFLKKDGYEGKTIFTIHNLRYQGSIGNEYLEELSLDEKAKLGGDYVNFMRAGFLYSDVVTTVSESYAKEIMKDSSGMEDIIRDKNIEIKGILNGVDYENYNPSKAGELEFPYNIKSIENKKKNKIALQRELNLENADVPLIASVTRLEDYKGIKLIYDAVKALDKPFQFVLLGTGNYYYEQMFKNLCENMKGSAAAVFEYDEALAKRIYAGSDIFLMPSLYEPCGIAQMIALKYGSIPIVRNTGGLSDTIIDYKDKCGNGFLFNEYSSEELKNKISEAIEIYNSTKWISLIKNAMSCDYSLEKSALKYLSLYKMILE